MLQEPVKVEKEKYDENSYEEMLNDVYGIVSVCGYDHDAGSLLKEIDPIAFQCGMNDSQEYDTVYQCPICDATHDDYDDALYCCQSDDESDDDTESED